VTAACAGAANSRGGTGSAFRLDRLAAAGDQFPGAIAAFAGLGETDVGIGAKRQQVPPTGDAVLEPPPLRHPPSAAARTSRQLPRTSYRRTCLSALLAFLTAATLGMG